jgi:hypothetical protein
MMMHSALDRLDELLGTSVATKKHDPYGRFQRASSSTHWMGGICPIEEYEIYGYVSSSDVKILALLDRDGIIPLKKREKEIDIKILFAKVHECYVKHTMNPFTKIRSKIEPPCTGFEIAVSNAMKQYNDSTT